MTGSTSIEKIPSRHPVEGAGLGLRRALLSKLNDEQLAGRMAAVDFMEVAPENWIDVGGHLGRKFHAYCERYPMLLHGLSLSLGSPDPLDEDFIRRIGRFMDRHDIRYYSDHLTFCSDGGHLYDLMPIPFTEEAARYTAERILRVQDLLGRRIAIENASYYAAPGQEISEIDFINSVLQQADCDLLLDINNIYVNSINHRYDPLQFLRSLPAQRIAYAHIAGHYNEADDLIIDTHGAAVIPDVWQLLDAAYAHFGVFPTLLERDFNFPPVVELLDEVDHIKSLQQQHQAMQPELAAVSNG
ncbi:MAG: DUF692 domain-containing protein [Gammaproteobacteria bacterium]|nr:DUF692 domain-containing protein [Gammaproteobacteria bacterium]